MPNKIVADKLPKKIVADKLPKKIVADRLPASINSFSEDGKTMISFTLEFLISKRRQETNETVRFRHSSSSPVKSKQPARRL